MNNGNEMATVSGPVLDQAESQLALRGIPNVPVQQVKNRYTTAMSVQKVRNLPDVDRRANEEAAMLGADSFYAWGQGKDRVEGPSVKLAMALVRIYGNCAVDLDEVQESRDAWIFTARFVDLETGFTLSRQFRQSKTWTVYGKFDEARKEDIRFQIGQSKATRNVILNALPSWLVSHAIDRAKGGVRDAIERAIADPKIGMEKVIDKAIRVLGELGVPENRILATMGRSLKGALTVEDLVVLQGNAAALKSGSESVDVLFPVKEENPAEPVGTRAQSLVDEIKAKNGDKPAEPNPEPAPGDAERKAKIAEQARKSKNGKGLGDASAEPPDTLPLGGQQ